MEKTARGRSREVRDLRRALQRFALDGTIHNALATAERLAREVSRAQELPSRNLPLTSPRPDVPEGETTSAWLTQVDLYISTLPMGPDAVWLYVVTWAQLMRRTRRGTSGWRPMPPVGGVGQGPARPTKPRP